MEEAHKVWQDIVESHILSSLGIGNVLKEGQEWGKFLVRSCINLFNLGADGKGVDRTNNLWIVPAVLTYYPRGRWQRRRSKSGRRI